MATRKTARWLDLIAFLLQHKYPVPRDDIFRAVRGYGVDPDDATDTALESARRKFERDKDELRALGIAIETLPVPNHEGGEPGSAYRLKPSAFYLPYFELDEGLAAERPYPGLERVRMSRKEVRVLDRATRRLAEREEFPLAEAARSVRQKLAFDLPLSQIAVERVLAHPLPPDAQAALAVLQRAVAERRAVRCTYHSMSSGQEATREIEPWGLWFERGHWYCVGHARDREAPRVFRADRMRHAQLIEGEEPFTVPRDFDVRVYLGRQPWEMGQEPPRTVRVRFGFPQSRWVVNEGRGKVIEAVLDDGGAILEFDCRNLEPLLHWLLTFRRQATVLDPPDVAVRLDQLRARVAGLYER
jgi:proteasome accessory factor B